MFSFPLRETCGFMFCMNKLMSFCHLHFCIFANGLTLCYHLMAFTPLLIWSLPIPPKHIWFCVASSRGVITQAQEGLMPNRCISSLAIKVFGCLHQQVDDFLHGCANMVWLRNDAKGPLLVVLCAFYRQRVSITLQRAQATSYLKDVVVVGEGSSKLITLSIFIPFFFYMFLATSEGFGT